MEIPIKRVFTSADCFYLIQLFLNKSLECEELSAKSGEGTEVVVQALLQSTGYR